MSATATTTVNNTPTIPIKQVTLKKFVPLVVSSISGDFKIQAKLFDDQKIQTFIQEILNQFEPIKEKNPSLYAIRLCSTNQYINEKNRAEFLSLNDQIRFHEVEICFNLETEVRIFIEKISSLKISNSENLIGQLTAIEKYIAADRIFAYEFFAKGGKKILIDYVKECDKASDTKKWNLLYHLFKILVLLIKNWSLISWDMSDIDLPIIKLICDTLNDSTKENKKAVIPDHLVLLFLNIVDDVLNNSQHTSELVLREIKFNDIVFVIQRPSVPIKEALLTFLNTCYNKANTEFVKLKMAVSKLNVFKHLNSLLTQPLMTAVFREEVRHLTDLNESQQTSDPTSPTSSNKSGQKIKRKFLSPSTHKSAKNSTSIDNNHMTSSLSTSLSNLAVKNYFKKKLSLSLVVETESSRRLLEVANAHNTANINNGLNQKACKDDKNIANVYKNFAMLQKNILDYDIGERMKISPNQQQDSNKIKSIITNAFDLMNSSTSTMTNIDASKMLIDEDKYSRLGFTNLANPIDDFKSTPPGLLALDFVEYITGKQSLRANFQNFLGDKFNKASDYSFPFVKASVQMVKYLCNFLQIGEKNELKREHEILFIMFTINHDGVFEFFSRCLSLFYRLWVEMKAQSLDFDKALSALKDSLYKIIHDLSKLDSSKDLMGLNESALVRKKLNDFNNYMDTWKYDYIKNIKNRFDKFNLEPVKELEKLLTDEIMNTIRPRRINVLTKGERFDRINLKEKRIRQRQFWKLSSDLRTLLISDCDDDNQDDDKYTDSIELERIKDVKKEEPRRQYYLLNLTCKRVDKKGDQNIVLASQSEEVIDSWYDGIFMLLNPKPTPNMTCFVECLIDTQLLDLQTLNLKIPNERPRVPDLPADFEFAIH